MTDIFRVPRTFPAMLLLSEASSFCMKIQSNYMHYSPTCLCVHECLIDLSTSMHINPAVLCN